CRIWVGERSRLGKREFRSQQRQGLIHRQAVVAPQVICTDYRCPDLPWPRSPPTGNRLWHLDVFACSIPVAVSVALIIGEAHASALVTLRDLLCAFGRKERIHAY